MPEPILTGARRLERGQAMAHAATILVAEDNEMLQCLVKEALEVAGYIVVQALSSGQLHREIERAAPDLIVLDIGLPDADGRDVLARLKKDPKTSGIPVVVWSGRDSPSDQRIALELGAEDYVEKGPASRLVGKIERLLLRLRLQA